MTDEELMIHLNSRKRRAVESWMADLFYASQAGWAAMEFNCAEAGLIEMIQGFEAGRMRQHHNGWDNYWCDCRWILTELGRRTSKARFEEVMKADPPLWVAEQDAQEEAEDVENLMQEDVESGNTSFYPMTETHRRNSRELDKRAQRILERSRK